VAPANEAPWSDLEQAFFDAAPPDEPIAQAELERFDDLVAPEQHKRVSGWRQAAANVWVALRRLLFGPARPPRPASFR